MIEQAHSGANGIPSWISSAQPSKYGGIVLCRSGNAVMRHNFQTWDVVPGAVLTFFPNDVIHLEPVSDDFYAEILRYSPDILREASMHIEDEPCRRNVRSGPQEQDTRTVQSFHGNS